MKKPLNISSDLSSYTHSIFTLLLIVPYFFKDEIESMVKDQASNYLDADLEFGHISFQLFHHSLSYKLGLQS